MDPKLEEELNEAEHSFRKSRRFPEDQLPPQEALCLVRTKDPPLREMRYQLVYSWHTQAELDFPGIVDKTIPDAKGE